MPRFARSLLAAATLLFASLSPAAPQPAPEAMVKDVTQEVLSTLRDDKAIGAGDSRRAAELIESRIAPHFDFLRMTELALGRHWADANDAQREELAKAFRSLLVRTYANALTAYKDQTVTFKPMRNGANGDEAIVQSQINQPGRQPVDLDYRLERANGEWKVIDVSVAGVSLVTNYRAGFDKEISSGGIEGLLKTLREKNADAAAKPPRAGAAPTRGSK